VLLNLVFWSGYSTLGRHAFFPLRDLPQTWLDRAVPYEPAWWGWVYLSQFTFTGVLPWFLGTRDGIRRYVVGVLIMSASSFLIFLFFPTAGPRPSEVGECLAMQCVVSYDGTLNAFPSLHAAFLVNMSALAWRMFGRAATPWIVPWGLAILYATLATKQHYALDLVAGGAIGWGADWLAWRGASDASAHATMARKSG
jgi:membrane-associated phospholipid phosphatase